MGTFVHSDICIAGMLHMFPHICNMHVYSPAGTCAHPHADTHGMHPDMEEQADKPQSQTSECGQLRLDPKKRREEQIF